MMYHTFKHSISKKRGSDKVQKPVATQDFHLQGHIRKTHDSMSISQRSNYYKYLHVRFVAAKARVGSNLDLPIRKFVEMNAPPPNSREVKQYNINRESNTLHVYNSPVTSSCRVSWFKSFFITILSNKQSCGTLLHNGKINYNTELSHFRNIWHIHFFFKKLMKFNKDN
jgi:hypothetical protein